MKFVKLQSLLPVIVLALCASTSIADSASVLMNANTATAEEIAGMPHMDEILAGVVVNNRPYVTIGELNSLLSSDLDEDQLEALYGRLFVPINLNDTTRSDILLIPGVGGRMAHELDDHRAYWLYEQARRACGKCGEEAEGAAVEP